MAYFLVKYDDVNAKTRPVDEANDVFGLKGIRLGGTLFDQTNIATKTEVGNVQSNLTALQNAYNAHVYLQNLDLAAIRADIASLYQIAQILGLDINAIMDDFPKEEKFVCTTGQTVFSATTISWSEDNSVFDLWVRRNGQVISLGAGRDYTKLNNIQIQLTMDNPVVDGEEIVIRVERQLLNIRFNQYFLSHIENSNGRGIFIPDPNRYAPGTDKLMIWRNGALLCKSNSIGVPVDRYEETTSKMITLGEIADPTDIISILNRTQTPNRAYQTGVVGTSLSTPSFTVGNRTLKVFRNGILMNTDGAGDAIDQYTEDVGGTSITLSQAALATEIFAFEISASAPVWMEIQTGFSGSIMTFGSSFSMGDDKLLVFRNGKLMYKSTALGLPIDRYTETSATSITLEEAAQATDWFAIMYSAM